MGGATAPTHLLEKGESFTSQGFDRVGPGCSDCPEAEYDQGDDEQHTAAGGEDPPAHGGFVSEVLQPFIAAPPGDGHGDQDSQADQFYEVAGEEQDELGDRGADDLADADLFCALVGDVDDQAEETEATDEYGETGGPDQQSGDIPFRGVEFGDGFVDEVIFVIVVGVGGVEGFFYGGEGSRPIAAVGVTGLQGD